MEKKIQICATVPQSLADSVEEISTRDNRTFSQTVALLLQQAVKERNRKRKDAKNIQVSDHSTNPRP